MTIVGSGASSPSLICNGNEDDSTHSCGSCKKLHETVSQMSDKLERLVVRVDEMFQQQQLLALKVHQQEATKPVKAQKKVERKASAPIIEQPQNGIMDLLSSFMETSKSQNDLLANMNLIPPQIMTESLAEPILKGEISPDSANGSING